MSLAGEIGRRINLFLTSLGHSSLGGQCASVARMQCGPGSSCLSLYGDISYLLRSYGSTVRNSQKAGTLVRMKRMHNPCLGLCSVFRLCGVMVRLGRLMKQCIRMKQESS